MLAVQNVQAIVTCRDPDKVPGKLELYYVHGKPCFEIVPSGRYVLPGGRVLLCDVAINDTGSGKAKPVDSVRMLRGRVLGLHDLADGNPAGISRISFLSEDAAFTMELREDGSLSECSWHHIAPYWDFPGYKDANGDRFRQPMYPDKPWTDSGDPWGFTRYGWEETH